MIILLLCVTISIASVGCKKDTDDAPEVQKIVKGCANMPRGTKCKEQECCSNRFLCLTGQGSDKDCTSGCNCQ